MKQPKSSGSWIPSMWKSAFHSLTQSIGEAWRSVDYSHRLLSITSIVLFCCTALLAVLLSFEAYNNDSISNKAPSLVWSSKLVDYTHALLKESSATQRFLQTRTSSDMLSLLQQRVVTDSTFADLQDYYDSSVMGKDTGYTDTSPSNEAMKSLGRFALIEHRAFIAPVLQTTTALSRQFYIDQARSVVALAVHTFSTGLDSIHRNALALVIYTTVAREELYSLSFRLQDAFEGSISKTVLTDFVANSMIQTHDLSSIKTSLRKSGNGQAASTLISAYIEGQVNAWLLDFPGAKGYPAGWSIDLYLANVTSTLTAAMSYSSDLIQKQSLQTIESTSDGRIPYIVICGAGVLFVVFNIAGGVRYDIKKASLRRTAINEVNTTVGRFHEYTSCFCKFDLDPTPPQSQENKDTSLVNAEMMLQVCIASVRALAPYIPHMLFPERITRTAKSLSEVRKQEQGLGESAQKSASTGGGSSSSTDKGKQSEIVLLSTKDVTSNPHLNAIRLKTQVGLVRGSVVTLVVDTAPLHKVTFGGEDVELSATQALNKVLTIVEQCVVLRGGAVRSVTADRISVSWNCPTPTPNGEENAAEAALTCILKINAARRTHKYLGAIPIFCGVTSGDVAMGVVGYDKLKTYQFYGQCVHNAVLVARVNATHGTSVTCDERTKDRVQHVFPCKPIEIIDGQIVYHVHSRNARREADFESKLNAYKKAFDLFEQRSYRDALKAFRQYTRQYGYDRSVERVQSLITG